MKKILIAGPIFSISGYGNYCRSIAMNLSRIPNIDIRLEVKNWGGSGAVLSPKENLFFHNLLKKGMFEDNEIEETTYLCIHLPDGYPINDPRFMKFKKRINVTMFETDNVLDSWAKEINKYMDELIVPTEFNKETFSKKVNIPINVFTYIKDDIDKYTDEYISDFAIPNIPQSETNKPTIYYHNCNYGARKGVIEVVRAYLNAFENKTPTQLWLKWYIDANHPESEKSLFRNEIAKLRKETNNHSSEIYLIHENYLPHQMEALYRSIDFYVMPSRGEGLNLPACEAILNMKPVILSQCSAHLSLIPEALNNLTNEDKFIKPYWIQGENKIIDNTNDPFYAPAAHKEKHNWFFTNEESLKELYKKSYHDHVFNTDKLNNTCKEIKQHLLTISQPEILAKRFDELYFNPS